MVAHVEALSVAMYVNVRILGLGTIVAMMLMNVQFMQAQRLAVKTRQYVKIQWVDISKRCTKTFL